MGTKSWPAPKNPLANEFRRQTLRAISGIIVLATVPLLPFLRPRLPPTSRHRSRPFNLAFMKYGTFWVFQSFSIIQALGYFVPINYLPSIAASLGTNPSLGSLALLITNLASIFGCLATGALVDRFDVMRIISAISLGAGAVVFLALGFSTSLWRLYIFGVFYGLTAGAYSTTWGGMIKEIVRCHPEADANIVFGFLAAGRGVGAISSGPLSESLLGGEGMWREGATSLYESQYGALVTFSACTAVAGGFGWFVRKAGLVW